MRDTHMIEVDVECTYKEILAVTCPNNKDETARLVAAQLTVAVFLQKASLMLESFIDQRKEGQMRKKRDCRERHDERLKLVP